MTNPELRERRIVTVLFSDLSGFTALGESMEPDDVAETVDALFKRFRTAIEGEGGTIDKFIGNAVVAVFGTPASHPDDSARGIRAGIAMQRDLVAFNAERHITLRMRVGIHTGEIHWGGVGGDRATAMAAAVAVAQRIESSTRPGKVLVSRATRDPAGEGFSYDKRDPISVRGRAEMVEVFEAREA